MIKRVPRMKLVDIKSFENSTEDGAAASDEKKNGSLINLDSPGEQGAFNTSLLLSNISDVYFDNALWPELKPHDWSVEACKLLSQPSYVVTLILCVLALIANINSIMAVKHIRSPITMHLKLIINLAASDISIVLGVIIHILNQIFNRPFALEITSPSERLINGCIFATVSSIHTTTFLISLFNVLTLAVDHYIAIMLPLSYQRIMSTNHGHTLIAVLWVTAAIGGFSNFLFGAMGYEQKQDMFNYCEYIMYDNYHPDYLVFSLTILCLIGITYIYIRIYCEVLRLQMRCSTPDDISHNRKALTTTLLIIGTFCVCWLPNCIFQIAMLLHLHSNTSILDDSFDTFIVISKYLYILQVTNSLLDPIIYAVRLNVVKSGYRNFLNRLKDCIRKKSCFTVLKRRCKLVPKKSGSRVQHLQGMDEELVISTSKTSTNHSTGIAESQNSTNAFSKLSNESDINENDIHAMVTVHSNELETLLDSMHETKL